MAAESPAADLLGPRTRADLSHERRFRAMGSDVQLIVVGGGDDLVARGQRRIDELEERWSRFRAESEISALNRAGGRPVRVSPDTVLLIRRAQQAWSWSGGAFDPTVLGDVIRAGYDRPFDEFGPDGQHEAGRSTFGRGVTDIVVDGDEVRLPPGVGFDPGGIGKGLAADLVAEELASEGPRGVCVNVGGDVRVSGVGPEGGPWTIAVEHPWGSQPIALIGLADGSVATSTTLCRRWVVDGHRQHHLIDPQTGRPSDTDLELAAVVAADTVTAEVLAKSVLLKGSQHPFDVVEGSGAEALAVDDRGHVQATPGLARFLGGRVVCSEIATATVLPTA